MIKIAIVLIFLSTAFCLSSHAQVVGGSWRGIVLLKSDKAEVEKLLGKPKGKSDIYETEKETVTVWYNKGFCKENKKSTWNVKRDTVVGMIVSPKLSVDISKYVGGDLKNFEKNADKEFKGTFLYLNSDESLEIETKISNDGVEEVIYTAYRPLKSELNLRCEKR